MGSFQSTQYIFKCTVRSDVLCNGSKIYKVIVHTYFFRPKCNSIGHQTVDKSNNFAVYTKVEVQNSNNKALNQWPLHTWFWSELSFIIYVVLTVLTGLTVPSHNWGFLCATTQYTAHTAIYIYMIPGKLVHVHMISLAKYFNGTARLRH